MDLEAERSERRMAMDALEKDVSKVWKELPEKYQSNKDFVLRALLAPKLPPKGEFERRFPQWLRFDRDVVLAFCARFDFEALYKERHLFVPECLTGDKEVMLAYCRKIPRSLQECSEDLCDDRDVVMAAIALDGLELQYASMRLQEERDIVVAACQKDGRALEFCPPGEVRQQLTTDRDFMLSVLRKHGGAMLRLVPDYLKHDRELLLEALKHGMRFRFCPFEFQSDKEFLLEALSRRSDLYLEMNRTTQAERDVAFAAVVADSSHPDVHTRAFTHRPELKRERQVALAIAERGEKAFLKQFLVEGPLRFRDDKDIMLTAVRRDSKIFGLVSHRLKQDTDIIMNAIDEESAADVLAAVGHDVQREFPKITIRAISVFSRRDLRVLRTHVPDDLWMNRGVAIAYIRRGRRVLDAFELLLMHDVEMALEVAQHAPLDFGRVGEALRSNLDFMKDAVDLNGRVLRYAAPSIRDDMDLIVRAVANHPDALRSGCRMGRVDIQNYVQSKLDIHKTFVEDFLRGIAIATPHVAPAHRSHLSMLDRGVETSQAFKQLIAKFLGVPVGEELRTLRKANTNLTQSALATNVRNPGTGPLVEFAQMPQDEGAAAAFMPGQDLEMADRWARRRFFRQRARDRVRHNMADGEGAAAAAAAAMDGADAAAAVALGIARPAGEERRHERIRDRMEMRLMYDARIRAANELNEGNGPNNRGRAGGFLHAWDMEDVENEHLDIMEELEAIEDMFA